MAVTRVVVRTFVDVVQGAESNRARFIFMVCVAVFVIIVVEYSSVQVRVALYFLGYLHECFSMGCNTFIIMPVITYLDSKSSAD